MSFANSLIALLYNPAISAGVAGLVGAVTTWIVSEYSRREKVSANIVGIQLSAHTLSRVDQIELPEKVAQNYSNFLPWLPETGGLTSSDLKVVPLGMAQECFVYTEYFASAFESCLALLNDAITKSNEGTFDRDVASGLLGNKIINGLFTGAIGRNELPGLSSDNEINDPLLPIDRVVDEKGRKAIRVNLGSKNAFYHYQSEQERSKIESYLKPLLCPISDGLRDILSSLREKITDARALALSLNGWFKENLDQESSLIISVAFSNLGQKPVLIDNVAVLRLDGADGHEISIPMRSEDFQADTANDDSANRVVKLYQRIAYIFEVAMTFDDKVSFDRTILKPNEVISVDFRSSKKLLKFSESANVLEQYRAGNRKAKFEYWYLKESSSTRVNRKTEVTFASNNVLSKRQLKEIS